MRAAGGSMKILITLDFPPERGGIQRYLWGIVQNTYLAGDRVLGGCARPAGEAGAAGLAVTVEYLWTPFSALNKKLSLVPLFVRTAALLRGSERSPHIEC